MKIIDIKPFVVDCFRTNFVFVKIYTDEGITGIGEGTLEYKEKPFWALWSILRNTLWAKIRLMWSSIFIISTATHTGAAGQF